MSWLFGSRRPAITLQTDRAVHAVRQLPTQPATPPPPRPTAAQRLAEGDSKDSDLDSVPVEEA